MYYEIINGGRQISEMIKNEAKLARMKDETFSQ